MSTVAEHLQPPASRLRSVNLELDADSGSLAGYLPTGRALESLRRLVTAGQEGTGGAWALTGPYGSGKSSLALFADGLLGPSKDRQHKAALALLSEADADLAAALKQARRSIGAAQTGVMRAVAVARREPLNLTVARALRRAAQRYFGQTLPRDVSAALDDMDEAGTDVAVLDALEMLQSKAPVLLVIDEFGKTLEQYAADPSDVDLFLMQELAERANRPAGRPVFLLTLQHLSFDDYLASATLPQRREWSKVQGRFADVSFVPSTAESVRLAASLMSAGQAESRLGSRIQRAAWAAREQWQGLGLDGVLPLDAADIGACYPLHPVSLFLACELSARYGQFGRTLVSFLASDETASAASFLRDTTLPASGPLPLLTADGVYDYFVQAALSSVAVATGGSRWIEIETRLRETHGLDDLDRACLKVVGAINLVSRGGVFRASGPVVAYALSSSDDPKHNETVIERLRSLVERSLLVYREFSDEFQLYEGSDYPLRERAAAARKEAESRTTADLLATHLEQGAIVAAAHSQRHGILRHFSVRYTDGDSIPAAFTGDGLLLYRFDGTLNPKLDPGDLRPVAVATAAEPAPLRAAAVEVAALSQLLKSDEDLQHDRVARREVQEQLAPAQVALATQVAQTFHPRAATWQLHRANHPVQDLPRARNASAALSAACDEVYNQAPNVANEMISRDELSSQGAKARRELVVAMVHNATKETLALDDGYGPERAMYEAVLNVTGIHRERAKVLGFGEPLRDDSYGPVWKELKRLVHKPGLTPVQEVLDTIAAPPYGVKEGLGYLLLVAVLLTYHEEVAIFELETFSPRVGADTFERIARAPERFAVKGCHVDKATRMVMDAIVAAGGFNPPLLPGRRNAGLLSVVVPILQTVRSLPTVISDSRRHSAPALAVLRACSSSLDPHTLLMKDLPAAVGAIPDDGWTEEAAARYAAALAAALSELTGALPALYRRLGADALSALNLPTDPVAGRPLLAQRAAGLLDAQADPKLKAFLHNAVKDDVTDDVWGDALGLNITGRPVKEWNDADRDAYDEQLPAVTAAFLRLEAVLARTKRGLQPNGRLLTLTLPNGTEQSLFVAVEDQDRAAIEGPLETALKAIRKKAGPRAEQALAAALLSRLLGPHAPTTGTEATP